MYTHRAIILSALLGLVSACDRGPVLATVGDKDITEEEFAAFMELKRLPSIDPQKRAALLDQYVEREALAAAIGEEDLLNEKLIAAELNEFRKEMLISRYFEKFLQEQVTDQAVQNYYNMHAADYEDKKVRVAHVLIRTEQNMPETERKARLTIAQEVYSKLSSGADFAEIADQYSEDRVSAKKGGDLGWLKEGAIDPRFSETVFQLKEGEISEPFETAFGFHIVKVLEPPMVVKRSFDAVKGDIRYQLRNEVKQAELERLTKHVKVRKET